MRQKGPIMAITLIKNDGISHQSIDDFRSYAASNPNIVFRMNNRQVDFSEIKDGDRVNVVVKASGNK